MGQPAWWRTARRVGAPRMTWRTAMRCGLAVGASDPRANGPGRMWLLRLKGLADRRGEPLAFGGASAGRNSRIWLRGESTPCGAGARCRVGTGVSRGVVAPPWPVHGRGAILPGCVHALLLER